MIAATLTNTIIRLSTYPPKTAFHAEITSVALTMLDPNKNRFST
jgi:hypothetical protein